MQSNTMAANSQNHSTPGKPKVSVVMSVYNGTNLLRETIESILSQEGVALEFIIVNDGSTDESAVILDEYANLDPRVRIINQPNQGLTNGLIAGCAASRGDYIARQDTGDISLPDRLAKQLHWIEKHPDAAVVSCGTRYVGPKDEHLFDVSYNSGDATDYLLTLRMNQIRGPSSHPSTLFHRSLYERVGGYRAAFYFAQDLDLWVRLAEVGKHIVNNEVLYQTSITVASISGRYRKEQVETSRIILKCARLRRAGLSESPALDQARSFKPSGKRSNTRMARASALYFIGACLRKQSNAQAQSYFKEALQAYPFHLKSAARFLFG